MQYGLSKTAFFFLIVFVFAGFNAGIFLRKNKKQLHTKRREENT